MFEEEEYLTHKKWAITGGTGSLGKYLAHYLINDKNGMYPDVVRIISRDEYKQSIMKREFNDDNALRFLIGDVRDEKRMNRAFEGIDYVIHCASMKQVSACEYNPIEAVKTNVNGAISVVNASINCNVDKVIFTSSDKATNPVNTYGVSKKLAEHIFIYGNVYSSERKTKFSCTKWGNVAKSRASVYSIWKEQYETGKRITVTDLTATRYILELRDCINTILFGLKTMVGGEIFVKNSKATTLSNLLLAVIGVKTLKDIEIDETGLSQGEKKHEMLITQEELERTGVIGKDRPYIIIPQDTYLINRPYKWDAKAIFSLSKEKAFTSKNAEKYTIKELKEIFGEV